MVATKTEKINNNSYLSGKRKEKRDAFAIIQSGENETETFPDMADFYYSSGDTGLSGNDELSEQHGDTDFGVVQSLDAAHAVYQLLFSADPVGPLLQLPDKT